MSDENGIYSGERPDCRRYTAKHANVDVFQNVFFGFVDKGKNIPVEIFHVQGNRRIQTPEHRAAQSGIGKKLLRFACKTEYCSIQ